MSRRWDARRANRMPPLDALVYRSRLIGEQESLGLYGGGNTSVKCREPNVLGAPQEVLWVKGSGANLQGCEARHFSPLPLAPLRALAARRTMADEEMVRFLERCLLDPKAPRPSIETLLHAFIPEPAVDHTHGDAILSLANTPNGRQLSREVLGPSLLWIPYLQPGFILSRRVWEEYQRHPGSHGAILEKHGLITWGADGRTSYERTLHYIALADKFIGRKHRQRRWSAAAHHALPTAQRMEVLRQWLPAIRKTLSRPRKVSLTVTQSSEVLDFVNARRLSELTQAGPATPDHMLRTKRLPAILPGAGRAPAAEAVRRLDAYAAAHRRYFRKHRTAGQTLQSPYPRVMLIPGVGMVTAGKDAAETAMVAKIYQHAMAIMRNAAAIGRYTSVSEREAFGVEYWPLELYKLSLAPPEAELAREVGLITGATGGIGRALAHDLVRRGASVVVTDLKQLQVRQLAEELNDRMHRRCAIGVALDVTRESSVARAFDALLCAFGGLDFLVSNAGVAHVASVERLRLADWERSLAVNATGHFLVARAAVRLLRRQALGGSLVFVASKNVLAPGNEFGAYSAAKAAETQLARVLAIENGRFGVRVNIINPDGVFDGSGLWKAIGPSRAKTYGLRPGELADYYRRRNLLNARVLPEDVAEAVAFFVSRRSAKTTGCILTVDGGLREAFPR